jgi:hypothetical protein
MRVLEVLASEPSRRSRSAVGRSDLTAQVSQTVRASRWAITSVSAAAIT